MGKMFSSTANNINVDKIFSKWEIYFDKKQKFLWWVKNFKIREIF